MRKQDLATIERERGEKLGGLLNSLGLLGYGVEVGVFRGVHACSILDHWKGELLTATDWWQPAFTTRDTSEIALKALTPYIDKGRCQLFSLESGQASQCFIKESLDFVYIDAAHDYESVIRDILLWTPKVKPGGLIVGHDFVDEGDIHSRVGVESAVHFHFSNIPFAVLYKMNGHQRFPEWIVEKQSMEPNPTILEYAEICPIRPR